MAAFSASATHLANMELSYRWKQDSTYEFTLIFYRNCQGFAEGPGVTFSVKHKSDSAGINGTFLLFRLPTSGTGVPSLEPPNLYNCTKNYNNLCIEEYVFRGNWTSPKRAVDWTFMANLCCRPIFPYFLSSANINTGEVWIQCGLNNLDFPDNKARNWSPFWHNRRPNHPGHLTDTVINFFYKTLCDGIYYTLDESVREYQGDSVTYDFYNPQGTAGWDLPYRKGFSLKNPIPTLNGPLKINPHTGIIQIIPSFQNDTGLFIIGVQAKEWRNDTTYKGSKMIVTPKLIGYVRRELTLWIDDSSDCRRDSLHMRDIYLDTTNADKKLDVYFRNGLIYPNSLIRCNTISPDGSEFRVVDSSAYVAPNASTLRYIGVVGASWTCQAGLTDHVTLTLTEPIRCGNYSVILKKGTDLDVLQSECGFWEPEGETAEINRATMLPVDLGKDKEVCRESYINVTLKAPDGYATYFWDTWDSTKNITVHYARKYGVEVTDNFGCKSTDTIEVKAVKCTSSGKLYHSPNNKPHNLYNGIDEEVEDQISLYPNPSNGSLYLKAGSIQGNEWIQVYDMSGKQVYMQQLHGQSSPVLIDLNDLEKGIYFLRFGNDEGILLEEKLVLTR